MAQVETVPVGAAEEATADTDPAALIDLDSASSRSSEAVAGEDTGREPPRERTHTMQTEAGGSLEVAPAGKLVVALGSLPAAGQCSNSRRLGLGCDPGEKAGRGKGQRVDEGAACCIRPSFVDYTPLKVSPPASYRSNGRRWRALRANPKVYLQLGVSRTSPLITLPGDLPCLLIVSPYVRANLGRNAPMLS